MKKKKRMGRPPAQWMFNFAKLSLKQKWTDAYEISKIVEVGHRAVKAFFDKLSVAPKYELDEGQVRAKFKVSDLKKAAENYIEPWR